jgi:hypothetical protein
LLVTVTSDEQNMLRYCYCLLLYAICDYVIGSVEATLATNVINAARCRVRCLADLHQVGCICICIIVN